MTFPLTFKDPGPMAVLNQGGLCKAEQVSGVSGWEYVKAHKFIGASHDRNVSCSDSLNNSENLDSRLCSYIVVMALSPALQWSFTAHLSDKSCLFPKISDL